MTFTESIYQKVSAISSLSTDEFSTVWLCQSRSYYSSLKSRKIEASNTTLVNLMNKLCDQQQAMKMRSSENPTLQAAAQKYDALAKEVAVEVARRAAQTNLGTLTVRKMLMKAITDLNEISHPSAPPIIIC